MGKLPAGWEVVRLGDLIEILDTQRQPIRQQDRDRRCAGKQASQLFPYYGATGQVGWIDDFRSEGPGILLGEDGAPFLDRNRPKAYPVDGRYWVNNHAHLLRPRDPRYFGLIWHQLNYVDYERLVSGTTRLKLTLDALRRIPIFTPPADEAERIGVEIGKLFTELDEAEAALTRARASLAEYRASLLHAACTGQLTAAWRASRPHPAEDGPALLRRNLAERRAAWERAELTGLAARGKPAPVGEAWKARYKEPLVLNAGNLSELPIGWVWVSIEQATYDKLIGLDRGTPQQRASPPGTLYIKMGDINSEGHLNMCSAVYVDASEVEQANFALQTGDLLFNTRNSLELVGKAGIVPANCQDVVFNNNLMRLRVTPSVCPDFLHAQMNAPGFKLALNGIKRATTNVAAIYAKDLMPLPVALPPKIEQEEIVEMLLAEMANIREQADRITEACRQLGTLRQSILHAAFTGGLVPQNPADEPAAALLARLRDAPAPARRPRKPAHAA